MKAPYALRCIVEFDDNLIQVEVSCDECEYEQTYIAGEYQDRETMVELIKYDADHHTDNTGHMEFTAGLVPKPDMVDVEITVGSVEEE